MTEIKLPKFSSSRNLHRAPEACPPPLLPFFTILSNCIYITSLAYEGGGNCFSELTWAQCWTFNTFCLHPINNKRLGVHRVKINFCITPRNDGGFSTERYTSLQRKDTVSPRPVSEILVRVINVVAKRLGISWLLHITKLYSLSFPQHTYQSLRKTDSFVCLGKIQKDPMTAN